jgi:transcriptional regulator with XRE-family HTH domain
MTLSDRIQQLINENNISQSELEKKLGFGKGTISKWKGSTAPSADKLQKIADHFGVTIDYLMTGRKYSEQGIETLAAHFDGDKLSEEEMEEIMNYVEFVKSRRK